MEDHRLKAFCLIVETRSFSKAAEAKFMTQSAMSHLVKNMEDDFNMKLLIRRGKNVVPTPAGRILYEHARKILAHYKLLEDDLYSSANKVRGLLSIGAAPTAATHLLPQVFYDFSRTFPEVRIDLSVSTTETIINSMLEGKCDLGIVDAGIKKANLRLEEIAEDEIVVVSSDDNPLAGRNMLTAADLLSQPLIMPETGSGMRELIEDFFHAAGLDIHTAKIAMVLGNPELIVQMVQSGTGISFVSKWSVFRAVREGTIRLLDIPERKLKRKFYLAFTGNEPLTMAGKTFRHFIKKYRFFMPA